MEKQSNQKGGMPEQPEHGNNVSLLFIVNSEPVSIIANLNQPLKVAVEKALKETDTEGRKLDDWLAKLNGEKLDITRKVREFNFAAGAQIFLSLDAGVGG